MSRTFKDKPNNYEYTSSWAGNTPERGNLLKETILSRN